MADELVPRPPAGVERTQRPRPAPGTRSAQEIRNDIVRQREQLAGSVDQLRDRWGEVTNLRRQVSKHKTELLIGAAVAGFVVGGIIAFSRRR